MIADWKLISGDAAFFTVTKTIHNALQCAPDALTPADEQRYLSQSERNAELLDDDYDIVVAHDPQPLALLELHGNATSRWIWRCHIDTSEPNPAVWAFLAPFVRRYAAAVFTLGGFVPPEFPVERIEIIPPAIDPQSPKNLELGTVLAERVLEWIGIDTRRPLITQVSRFDPWKDPLGVIAAYRLIREHMPEVQLALVGSMALDDPQGWEMYHAIQAEVRDDNDVHLFTNLNGVGNIEVNAFQRLAQVVIQKSIREGFGLVVSESLWKGTPVVAGRAGGIPSNSKTAKAATSSTPSTHARAEPSSSSTTPNNAAPSAKPAAPTYDSDSSSPASSPTSYASTPPSPERRPVTFPARSSASPAHCAIPSAASESKRPTPDICATPFATTISAHAPAKTNSRVTQTDFCVPPHQGERECRGRRVTRLRRTTTRRRARRR